MLLNKNNGSIFLKLGMILFLFISFIFFAACSKAVESIDLDKTNLTLEVGEQETVIATVKPDDATEKKVTWESENEAVATVNDGVIVAVGLGETTITAKSGEKTAIVSVAVNPRKFTVSFDTNGGTPIASQIINDGAKATTPMNPAQVGHTFGGWYKEATTTTPFNFDDPITADTVIYAKWNAKTYTVLFVINSGNNLQQAVNHGEKVTEPDDPNKPNHTFAGWYIDEEYSALFDFNTPITSNLFIYAKWNLSSYNVYFYSNGGNEIQSLVVNIGEKAVKPMNPTKEGNEFGGWFIDQACLNPYDWNTVLSSDLNLYAKWNSITYTVSFNVDDDTQISDQIVNHNAKAVIPQGIAKEGFKLDGWYVDEEYFEKFDFDSVILENITLYGRWVESNQVTIILNGGQWSGEGYEFAGIANVKDSATPSKTNPVQHFDSGYSFENALNSLFLYNGSHELFLGEGENDAAWWGYKMGLDEITKGVFVITKHIANDNDIIPGTYDYILMGIWRNPLYEGFTWLTGLKQGDIIVFTGFDIYATAPGPIEGTIEVYSESDLEYGAYRINLEVNGDLPIPTKDNATFAGWYDNPEFIGSPITEVTDDIILYAKWDETIE